MEAARAGGGSAIGLGSDWSPTGSKNLLGELKVAWLYSQHVLGGLFRARDLVAMATREAARIREVGRAFGTIATGTRADMFVIDGAGSDPYEALIQAKETAIRLVMSFNGIARYGSARTDGAARARTTKRCGWAAIARLFLKQETVDPDVAVVSLRTATTTLRDALRDIAKLAKKAEAQKPITKRRALDTARRPVWSLVLDEIQDRGDDIRPRLPFRGPRDFTGPASDTRGVASASLPLSTILKPINLDPLTVADDNNFLDEIEQQPNVPPSIKNGLRALY